MSKKFLYLLLLAVLLAQLTSSVAFAAAGSSCPPGFMLMTAMHEHDPGHQHVGTSADQNGDGYICVKHITLDESIHVHVDNNIP